MVKHTGKTLWECLMFVYCVNGGPCLLSSVSVISSAAVLQGEQPFTELFLGTVQSFA